MDELAGILGHSSTRSTRIYVHYQRIPERIAKLDAVVDTFTDGLPSDLSNTKASTASTSPPGTAAT